jgi:hypothetical protein
MKGLQRIFPGLDKTKIVFLRALCRETGREPGGNIHGIHIASQGF